MSLSTVLADGDINRTENIQSSINTLRISMGFNVVSGKVLRRTASLRGRTEKLRDARWGLHGNGERQGRNVEREANKHSKPTVVVFRRHKGPGLSYPLSRNVFHSPRHTKKFYNGYVRLQLRRLGARTLRFIVT